MTWTKAKAEVDDMCRRLLANPIIEDYRFEITSDDDSTKEGN